MITETSGFNYMNFDCGYKWIPSVERGLPQGSSTGKAIAVILDGAVVYVLGTYPPIWDALRDGQIVDVTQQHQVPDGDAVIDVVVNGATAHTLHISHELFAAAITSNPTLVEITSDTAAVMAGWTYSEGKFYGPN
jgi:hypothetical protein